MILIITFLIRAILLANVYLLIIFFLNYNFHHLWFAKWFPIQLFHFVFILSSMKKKKKRMKNHEIICNQSLFREKYIQLDWNLTCWPVYINLYIFTKLRAKKSRRLRQRQRNLNNKHFCQLRNEYPNTYW